MSESPKRALTTGITGQDGSYLAELLLEAVDVLSVSPSAADRPEARAPRRREFAADMHPLRCRLSGGHRHDG